MELINYIKVKYMTITQRLGKDQWNNTTGQNDQEKKIKQKAQIISTRNKTGDINTDSIDI